MVSRLRRLSDGEVRIARWADRWQVTVGVAAAGLVASEYRRRWCYFGLQATLNSRSSRYFLCTPLMQTQCNRSRSSPRSSQYYSQRRMEPIVENLKRPLVSPDVNASSCVQTTPIFQGMTGLESFFFFLEGKSTRRRDDACLKSTER